MVQAGVFMNVAMAGIKALQQQRRQHHARPEHGVRVRRVFAVNCPRLKTG